MSVPRTTDRSALRGADALARKGSTVPAPANPFNLERREGVPPPNPATGPKTPEGKSKSSRNAVTHGLRAAKIENAVAPELRAAYEQLRQQFLDDYHPAGAIESTLLDLVIFAVWQLYKIREMELFTDIDLGAMGSFGREIPEAPVPRLCRNLARRREGRHLRGTRNRNALRPRLPPQKV